MKPLFPVTRKSLILAATGLLVLVMLGMCRHPGVPNASSATGQSHLAPNVEARSAVVASSVTVIPSGDIDERLFLLRVLDELNASWPDENLPSAQLQSTIVSLRQQAVSIRNHIQDGALDEKLKDTYDRFIQTTDAYTTYLEDLGRIERTSLNRAEQETSESGFKAGWNGAKAGYDVSDNGVSTTGSLATAGVVALGSYLWDDYQKGKERDEAKRQASNAARSKMMSAVNDYLAMCGSTALALSEKYRWKKGEAGFDEPADFSNTFQSLVKQGNTDGLAQVEHTLAIQRPRDPFVMCRQAYFESLNPNGLISAQVAAGKRCVQAASLVPKGAFYDEFRVQMLFNAGEILDRVSDRETYGKGWGKGFNQNAALAMQVWQACLNYQTDVTGELRERKAWDQFKSGDLNGARETVTPLVSLRQNNLQFSYNMACLLSDLDDCDNSLAWLKQAVIALGCNKISTIKTDPDLAMVRARKADEIDALTAIHCTWKIEYGVFNDDIVVVNQSSFALTNVSISGRIYPNNKPWVKDLTVDVLPVGASYKWSDVVSVPGSKANTDSSTDLHCDQGVCRPTRVP